MEWQPVSPCADDAIPDTETDRAHATALERGDEVVQQLAVAKYALTIGDTARTMAAIDAALEVSRRVLSDLLDLISPPETLGYAGAMVRRTASDDLPYPRSDSD